MAQHLVFAPIEVVLAGSDDFVKDGSRLGILAFEQVGLAQERLGRLGRDADAGLLVIHAVLGGQGPGVDGGLEFRLHKLPRGLGRAVGHVIFRIVQHVVHHGSRPPEGHQVEVCPAAGHVCLGHGATHRLAVTRHIVDNQVGLIY